MAEDVKIRLVIEGRDVVATLGDVDEGLDDIISRGEDAEEQVDQWGDTVVDRSSDVTQSYEQVSAAQQQLAISADASSSAAGRLGASFADLQQRSQLAAADMREATFQTQELATEASNADDKAGQIARSLGRIGRDAPKGIAEISGDLKSLGVSLGEVEGGFGALIPQLLTTGNLIPIVLGATTGLAAAFGGQLFEALQSGNEQLQRYEAALQNIIAVEQDLQGTFAFTQDEAEARLSAARELVDQQARGLANLESRIQELSGRTGAPRALVAQIRARRDEASERLGRLEAIRDQIEEQLDVAQINDLARRELGGAQDLLQQQLDEAASAYSDTMDLLRDDLERGIIDQEDFVQSSMQAQRTYAEELRRLDRVFEEVDLSPNVDMAFERFIDLREELERLRATVEEIPERPPIEPLEAQDVIGEQVDVRFEELIFEPLSEMEMRLQTIQRLQSDGILTGAEADRQRLDAARRALRRLQEDAEEGRDVTEAQIQEARALIAQLSDQTGDAIEGETASGFARGLQSGAQQGFRQAFQPLIQGIESDLERALVSAMLDALASAAAAALADLLSGGESEGFDGGQLLGGLLGTGLSVLAGGLFAGGGFTGEGDRMEPAGIVHRGEYVIPKDVVDVTGPAFWQDMASLDGFAMGGYVGASPSSGSSTSSSGGMVREVRRLADEVARMKQEPAPTIVTRQNSRQIGDEARRYEKRRRPSPPSPNR